ncbi:MAG: hypothetical protein NVS1B3_13710 [Candidatus Dormibacteraceae bacterium]
MLGAMSRQRHTPLWPASIVAGRIVRRLPPGEQQFRYRDRFGYTHVAWLGDQMELAGFLGSWPALPPSITNRIARGEWVIDAGANVGLITAQLCSLVGSSGRVIAFEPIPRNLERLAVLREENNLTWLDVRPQALSDRPATIAFSIPPRGGSGWATASKGHPEYESLNFPAVALDSLELTHRVSFLKLDVEGWEANVLAGGRAFLKEHRPLIHCEFNEYLLTRAGSSSAALVAAFAEVGYRPEGLVPAGDLFELVLTPG